MTRIASKITKLLDIEVELFKIYDSRINNTIIVLKVVETEVVFSDTAGKHIAYEDVELDIESPEFSHINDLASDYIFNKLL